ncbi:MAG: hypothetical protein RR036_01360 [Oscillospiraceae bacterium]
MTTPIYDFLKKYVKSDGVRCHMPGHKGRLKGSLLENIGAYDITEIRGADSLYSANGIIEESEKNTSALYETKASLVQVARLYVYKLWCRFFANLTTR